MKQSLQSLPRVAGAAGLAFALGCAGSPKPVPVASTEARVRDVPSTTTTSAVVAPPKTSSSLSVSDDLRQACQIRFDDVLQAPKFDFDTSELRPDDGLVLDQIATCLTTGPLAGRSIRLVGRADPRGEVEYNFALGSRRADSVESYLRHLGVDPAHMTETSRGKLDATGTDEATWQRDRRVDVGLM